MKKEIRLLEDDNYDLNDKLPAELDIDAIRAEAKRRGREYRGRFAGVGVRVEPEIIEFFKNVGSYQRSIAAGNDRTTESGLSSHDFSTEN